MRWISMKEDSGYLFYDGPYDALQKSIATSGKNQKEIASILWPGRDIGTAKSLLSRSLSPENTDVHLSPEKLLTIMKETRPEDFIFFLCDEFGFERPVKRVKKDVRREIESEVKNISATLTNLMKKLSLLEGREDEE